MKKFSVLFSLFLAAAGFLIAGCATTKAPGKYPDAPLPEAPRHNFSIPPGEVNSNSPDLKWVGENKPWEQKR
jgi:hypothetical protein